MLAARGVGDEILQKHIEDSMDQRHHFVRKDGEYRRILEYREGVDVKRTQLQEHMVLDDQELSNLVVKQDKIAELFKPMPQRFKNTTGMNDNMTG